MGTVGFRPAGLDKANDDLYGRRFSAFERGNPSETAGEGNLPFLMPCLDGEEI